MLLLATALVPAGAATAAATPRKPSISKVSASSGPLTPISVTITGRSLKRAKKVQFGSELGTDLRQVSAKKVTVTTPSASAPGQVDVRIKTRAGWSRVTPRSVFTYQAPTPPPPVAPQVTSLSPVSGSMDGGNTVTVTGSGFTPDAVVRFGGERATGVQVASPTALSAVAPVNLDGQVPVSVTTSAGEGATAGGSGYTYLVPAAADTVSIDLAPGTFEASTIDWVTGGPQDPDATSADQPWVVGLPSSVTPPTVGQQLVVPPGTSAYPVGVAGKVSEVAVQADLSHAVTIVPGPLSSALDDLDLHYAGQVADPSSTLTTSRTPRAATAGADPAEAGTPGTVEFPGISPSKFECEGADGSSRSFTGEVGFRMENLRSDFDFHAGHFFSGGPRINAWAKADIVVHGKVSASDEMSCALRPQYQNSLRRVLPLGTTGATLSVAPTASFKISADGTIKVEHTTARMVGVTKLGDDPLRTINISTDRGFRASGSARLEAEVSAGLEIQFGMLDRVGFQAQVVVTGNATVTLQSPPPEACVAMRFTLDISLKVFLDLWVSRWERDLYNHSVPISSRRVCSAIEPDAVGGDPEIATGRLPRAVNGRTYAATLETADQRAGTWSAPGGLPAGLALDPDTGQISGVPHAQVGDYALTFRFTDEAGTAVQAIVRLYVGPDVLAGGDVQVTLLWSSPADLDLHVFDPSGEEIYYGNPQSASGGSLDHDSNAACGENLSSPVENVAWPTDQAPEGGYSAVVDVWAECDTTDLSWRLIVRVDGEVVADTRGAGNSGPVTFSRGASSPRPGPVAGRISTPQKVDPR